MLLLLLFSCYFATLSAIAPCPLPQEVAPADYPPGWKRGGDLIQWNDGTYDRFECRYNLLIYYIMQLGPGAKTYTTGLSFRCDVASGKWIHDDGFEAPARLNCGGNDTPNFPYCVVKHQYSNGATGNIALYTGAEQYCPDGEAIFYVDGRAVRDIRCTGFELKIVAQDGSTAFYTKQNMPTMKCGPVSCPIKNQKSTGDLEDIVLHSGSEQYCPSGEIMRYATGVAIKDITCDRLGLKITSEDGSVIDYDQTNPPTLECVAECPIKNQLSTGALEDITLFTAKEQYCPSGEFTRFANGRDVKDIHCKGSGLEITNEDGSVIVYTGASLPTLTCTATCPIRNWLPTGALENKVIEAGKEQYCPDGQIVASSDGKPLKDIKCTRATLTVETEDGRTMSYPKPLTRATLKCVPGICKKVCGGPTTTTSTTTVAPTTTTTTVAPDRPPTANQLWNFNFYYNYLRILHAFCSDQTCINAIQANGIGYDMVSYWDVIGRAIREDSITAVRAACPTGSANLVNLGFTRVGNHYEHNFSGSGLKQGWVSIVNGACGASVAVKRWKCRMSEDMMYDSKSLETNTYYQGLVMDGGKAQFYLW